MTICVYWKGKFATDRQISIERGGEYIGKFSETKIKTYDEHSPFLFKGHRIRAIAVAGATAELDQILMDVACTDRTYHERVNYDLLNYFALRKEGGGKYDITTWILSDQLYRVNWSVLSCRSYHKEQANSTLIISEPDDVELPRETIEWCSSAEEVAWLYCGFSQQCGFGVDVLDCATGEVTYHPYPTETVRQNIRRTLLDNLDRFFVRPIREEEVEELVYEF